MNPPILIVEDDRALVQLIRTSLETGGYDVVVAHCGAEALRLAKLKRPRLVLLDLGLPDLPGEEVCRGIKELGQIPVIIVTAKTAAEERIAGFALGADDYVVKPFSLPELVLRIKCILRRVEAGRNEVSRQNVH